jgi:tetratricopeptide (TPR) repeat protein
VEPDNKAAKKGIKKIESQLFLLARTKYDKGDMAAAQKYLKQINVVNPHLEEANKLSHTIQNHLKTLSQLDGYLKKADEKLKRSDYTKPENDNAFYYYQQVLILDPENKAAEKGIKNIEDQLYKQASTAYKKEQYNKSLDYLAQLKSVNSGSKDAKTLESKIKKQQSRDSQIAIWLNQAETQKKNNYYTSPKKNNAFETYNKILKLEPNNKQALDGLKNIQWHYRSQFNQHIDASKLSKAENDIRIMKKISAPSSTIKQMQQTLKDSRLKISAANKEKKTVSRPLDIQQVSNIVGEFKTALQQRDKNKLKDLSQYVSGREQFVNQLLSQYKNINVKISSLQLISKENKARAQVDLTDLVDINNKKIIPGNWSQFEITVQDNSNNQLKVYW